MASWANMAAAAADKPEPTPQPVQQRNRRAAPAPRMTAELEQIFIQATQRVFEQWTLLQLAVEGGWGEGNGRENAQRFVNETLGIFQTKRNIDAYDIEDFFILFLDEHFHCISEDGSPREVANILMTLFTQCCTGDVTLAQQILAQQPAQTALAQCVAGAEPQEFDGDASDDEMDMGEAAAAPALVAAPSMAAGVAPAAAANGTSDAAAEGEGMAVDDDGWQIVTRSGRRAGRS